MTVAQALELLSQANLFALGFAVALLVCCASLLFGERLDRYFERRRRVVIARARQTRVPHWPRDEGRNG